MTKFYTEEQKQQIIGEYLLSQEELEKTIDSIYKKTITGLFPSQNPIAIIVGGQPGAGKTSVINYALNRINEDKNTIVVDNDIYRLHHPKINEINTKYPDLFTECTDQLSFATTPVMIERLKNSGYNMVIHQTLKNNRIADDAMKKLIDSGYIVGVMCLAVSDILSNFSMIDRSLIEQQFDGSHRWVPQQNHDFAYNGIPGTIDYIENGCKNYNFIEILMRGESFLPVVIYQNTNPENNELVNSVICEKFPEMPQSKYYSARDAIEKGRKLCEVKTLESIDDLIEEDMKIANNINDGNDSEARRRLNKLQEEVASRRMINGK